MADLVTDGMMKVSWVATIASILAPTAAELNAGVSLEGRMTPDGLQTDLATTAVPSSKLASTYDTAQVGRRAATLGVTYIDSDQASDAVRSALVYRAAGFLAVRRNKAVATNPTFVAGDKVDVYPASAEAPQPHYGANVLQTYMVPLVSTAEPAIQVAVV